MQYLDVVTAAGWWLGALSPNMQSLPRRMAHTPCWAALRTCNTQQIRNKVNYLWQMRCIQCRLATFAKELPHCVNKCQEPPIWLHMMEKQLHTFSHSLVVNMRLSSSLTTNCSKQHIAVYIQESLESRSKCNLQNMSEVCGQKSMQNTRRSVAHGLILLLIGLGNMGKILYHNYG